MGRVFAVIMAGGKGERLWPLSTPAHPKQFLPLLEGKSLLRVTAERVLPLLDEGGLFVVVPQRYLNLVIEDLALPPEQIIVEPEGRNTAPALGLAAVVLQSRDPNGVMVALPADHLVAKAEEFRRLLRVAISVAQESEHLVTLGITPDRPATGYGYIRRGPRFTDIEGVTVYQAEKFVEKPDRTTAEAYLAEGRYFWNSGMFIWRIDVFLRALSQHMPSLYASLSQLQTFLGSPKWGEMLAQVYSGLPAISIDYGVMEKAQNALVIPADIGWSDLGDWPSLAALFSQDASGNAVHAEHIGIDTKDCIIYAEDPKRVVATLGLQGLVIVETKEALLVMPKERAQEVRVFLQRRP